MLTIISGDFTASCINCSLRGHTEMECMCRNVKEGHRYVPAHIDLSKYFMTRIWDIKLMK